MFHSFFIGMPIYKFISHEQIWLYTTTAIKFKLNPALDTNNWRSIIYFGDRNLINKKLLVQPFLTKLEQRIEFWEKFKQLLRQIHTSQNQLRQFYTGLKLRENTDKLWFND